MLGEVLHDGIDQLAHAAEAAGQDRPLAQVSEEAFDQIQSHRHDEPLMRQRDPAWLASGYRKRT